MTTPGTPNKRMEAMRNAVLQGQNVLALQLAGDLARDYLGTAL